MHLRELRETDAEKMLDWMHDINVVGNLQAGFLNKTISDCRHFIFNASNNSGSIHFAIASDNDDYCGTVSLKHINRKKGYAEFAIVVNSQSMGKGYSWFAMNEIFNIAFEKESLNCIFWCVSVQNERACKFYNKHGFKKTNNVDEDYLALYQKIDDLIWYCVDRKEWSLRKQNSTLYQKIKIKTIETATSGKLSFIESLHDIPFDIKRIYYIHHVDSGMKRGFHAHKQLKQLIFCICGKISLLLDDGKTKEEVLLVDPSYGVYINRPIWREILWIEKNSVLCVLASDYYNEDDYIRDYNSFLKYVKEGK